MAKPKRGKPRRAKHLGKVSTVCIDAESKELLRFEFGSLGNALYFIADGIKRFRQRHGIGKGGAVGEGELALTFGDFVLMRDILWHRIDRWRGDDKASAPATMLLRKLERLLYADGVFYKAPPPIADVPIAVSASEAGRQPKKKRKTRFLGVDPCDNVSDEFRASGKNPHIRRGAS